MSNWIDMAPWDTQPVPNRRWLIKDRIPLLQPTLLSGEGAVGKSLLVLHLLASTALGRDWLGFVQGTAWYVGAEDPEEELWIRSHALTSHFGVSYADLTKAGFRMRSLYGGDAVLGALNRNGRIEPTKLFHQLYEQAGDLKPKCIAIDASADVFAGNEIDRGQTRQFVGLLRSLACVCEGAVILLSHPSLAGIASGSGLSGSTAWHNSMRARIYVTTAKTEPGEQADSNVRELMFKKNNYGEVGANIILQYNKGLFLPVPQIGTIERAAIDATAEQVFLQILRKFNERDVKVSTSPNANNFAPTMFAKEAEAKDGKLSKASLKDAMERLFKQEKIRPEQYGPPSKTATRLVLT